MVFDTSRSHIRQERYEPRETFRNARRPGVHREDSSSDPWEGGERRYSPHTTSPDPESSLRGPDPTLGPRLEPVTLRDPR